MLERTRVQNPFYNADHEAFRDVMRRFVTREIEPYAHEWDEAGEFPRALYAKAGPDARGLDPAHLDYEITRLLLELEDDKLRERSDYNEAAQGEAERAGDRDEITRLMNERRQINEARLSLDRRRDQTRLLASHRR